MVRMELSRIIITETSDKQVIVLKEQDGARTFPIVVGIYEATAIDRGVKEQRTARPLTHDLISSILRNLEVRLERVVVTELRHTIFYAKLVLQGNGRTLEVDSRPSDAIAIAVQEGAPIYVDESVLAEVCNTEGIE